MKIFSPKQLKEIPHEQLYSASSGETYSLSAVVSDLVESQQFFIHHDVTSPGDKTSASHRHTINEEYIYVLKGSPTLVTEGKAVSVFEGSLICLDPRDKQASYLINQSEQVMETLTFSIKSEWDVVVYSDNEKREIHLDSLKFPALTLMRD